MNDKKWNKYLKSLRKEALKSLERCESLLSYVAFGDKKFREIWKSKYGIKSGISSLRKKVV